MITAGQYSDTATLPEPVRRAILILLHAAREARFTGTAAVRVNFNQGGVTTARAYLETPAPVSQ